jgi:hypothetical protein
MRTRYQPADNGYEIVGSRELFNRTLYGSHAHDDHPERFFTFAGDLPLFMGAVTDWSKALYCQQAKRGVLMSGLALTPGLHTPFYYSTEMDMSSHWFHQAEDIVAVFRNGWMEYELRQFSPWFPDVKVTISAFPLMPEDGYLIHYRIATDQRVIFCAGFGGMTEPLVRFEYSQIKEREFSATDCTDNTVQCGKNRAVLTGPDGETMWIGASFPVTVEAGDAQALQENAPGIFLKAQPTPGAPQVVKLFAPIGPGETLDGFLVVIRNADDGTLDKWLNCRDPVNHLKEQIELKHAAISVQTPDAMLNLTVPPTVLAIDASWHHNTFHHGAFAYHTPFLGWRNWYGPTVIGWHDRVAKAIQSHFSEIKREAPGKESVTYDGNNQPGLNHESTQYHHIENSTGFLPALLGGSDIYNMQEVAIHMLKHHLEWSGDLSLAKALFADLQAVLDWEERILDPDHDGLYQNFLNTWISDGHSYNGGGCAQASAYNFAANLFMGKLAMKLGCSGEVFETRARAIHHSLQTKLWIPSLGVIAEYLDTIGNKLIHPSPELSTIYLSIECGVVDPFQAYQMLRFTETDLRNERTLNRQGRLVYSSNWYPKRYSTCGLFPAENIHLALAYFSLGLRTNGLELLNGIVDSYFLGKSPGMANHILTAHGGADSGDQDFSDVSSMYLRLIVEGIYGIKFHLLDNLIEIAPNFPADWTHAVLKLRDISLAYCRVGSKETFSVDCQMQARKRIKVPLRSATLEAVRLNDAPVNYQIEAGVNACFLVVETILTGSIHLQIKHGSGPVPAIRHLASVINGNALVIDVTSGIMTECLDPSGSLNQIAIRDNKLQAVVTAQSAHPTVFIRVHDGLYDAWLAADFAVDKITIFVRPMSILDNNTALQFEPLDISRHFNLSLNEIHNQQYLSPRPKGYSIGVCINGRHAWDWNQGGHNAVQVDDTALRQARGLFRSPSGIGFRTPETGANAACVSVWDNFPTVAEIPLRGKAVELALFFIGVTNPMQSRVENARLTVNYADRSKQIVSLIHPENFDDWLNAALQPENETVYFSDYNHGIVQRIALAPAKELASLTIEAIANEVIVGLLGISILPEENHTPPTSKSN